MEKFVKTFDFDGYIINELGECYGVPRVIVRKNGRKLTIKGRKMTPTKPNKDGYIGYQLSKADGKKHAPRIHRLVWESFNGKVPEGYEVGHKDCNPANNRLDNLYLCTHPENCNHPITRKRRSEAMKGNTISKGLISPKRRKIVMLSLDYAFEKEYEYLMQVKEDGFDSSNVCCCCKNKYLKEGNNIYKGHRFMYLDEYESTQK